MNDFTVNDSDRIKELEEEIESLKKAGNFVTGEDAKRFDDEMRKNETRPPSVNKDIPVFKTEIEQERDELKAVIAELKATHIETKHGRAISTSEKFRRLEQERDELKAEQSQGINETKARGIEEAIAHANSSIDEESWAHGAMIELKFLMEYVEQLRSE